MNDNQKIESNPAINLNSPQQDILDDLITPYFRKSVSYSMKRCDELVEEKINNYLENIGVYFVEQGEEAVNLSRKKCSIQAANHTPDKLSGLTDTPIGTTRLSSFNMSSNDLFQRRKLSSMKNTHDN